MKLEKEPGRAKSYLRRKLLAVLLFVLFLCIVPLYTQFFSPKQRLWAELTAYKKSIDVGQPRPDLAPHLTSNSIPFLLEWIETKEIPRSWQQSLAYRVRAFAPSLASKLVSLDSSIAYYPPSVALLGFEFLGSQASSALPALRELALSSGSYDDATMALIAIGPNAFPIAVEFAHHSQLIIRRTGAILLGALRSHPAESSRILSKMLDDPDAGVRREAYQALAEFPSATSESLLVSKLVTVAEAERFDVAYALHSSSTNALLHLLGIARDSTNRTLRIAVLGALAFRDEQRKFDRSSEPWNALYRMKRPVYNNKALNMGVFISANSPGHLPFNQIRSNILKEGVPRIEVTLNAARPAVTLPAPE